MGAITQFLKKDVVFEPHDIKAMSMALDDVCKSLHLLHGDPAREVIAERIIALASAGVRSPIDLRDRVIEEASTADEDAVSPRGRSMSTATKEPPRHY